MSPDSEIDILVDTDVWSITITKRTRDPRRAGWIEALRGKRLVLAVQSRVEILLGLRELGEQRARPILKELADTPGLPVSRLVQDAWVDLTSTCVGMGHGLGQKHHVADRWVAATAIAHGLRMLSGDRVYRGAPGLSLMTGDSR